MQLTNFTDYALRVLLYLGNQNSFATVREIADFHDISYNHLIKVVHQLALRGYVHSEKGRNGGISLAKSANEIGIGDVVRDMEPTLNLIDCSGSGKHPCVIIKNCQLQGLFCQAVSSFLNELDSKSLADLL